MEFDHVKIADDAWKMSSDDEKSLCYVAVTRAKYRCDCEPILRLLEEKYNLK
jgi:DNA helicase IV